MLVNLRLTLLLFLPLIFINTPIGAQPPAIAGQINQYKTVEAIDFCTSTLTLNNAFGLEAGMEVLIIQMQGAVINISDSFNFGDVTDSGQAGRYELAIIQSINGNEVELEHVLLNSYETVAKVQLVTVPNYSDVEVANTLVAQNWNGNTGGVIALRATGTLSLNAPISANAVGFRGGIANITASNDCSWITNQNDYYYDLSSWRGAAKGEGFASFTSGREAGRGAQASGGGGGNDHNAGGGGGANISRGGSGGINDEPSTFGCDGDYPGFGGKVIQNVEGRLFLGGGGGAGHENNGVGTNGGTGGGIVIILANVLISNGFAIMANGANAIEAAGDGAGGGGAGGTVVVEIETFADNLTIEARGGAGGSANNGNAARCFGPGGGGSGGRVLLTNGLSSNVDVAAGMAGVTYNSSEGGCNGTNNANPGETGVLAVLDSVLQSNIPNEAPSITMQPQLVDACLGEVIDLIVETQGIGLTYQWEMDQGGGFVAISEGAEFAGTTSASLTISELTELLAMSSFRLVVSSDCFDPVLTETITFALFEPPVADFEFLNVGNQVQFTNNSSGGDAYLWTFGDGNTSMDEAPMHAYDMDGTYTVTLTVTNACGSATISQTITITTIPTADFSITPAGGCVPLVVAYNNLASSNATTFEWSFPGGMPATSTDPNPLVTYTTTGTFSAQLIASNSAGSDTLFLSNIVVVDDVPMPDFAASVNQLEVSLTNNSVNADTYLWEFGDGNTSMEETPTHTYDALGVYTITLTAFNNCGQSSIQLTIVAGPPPEAAFAVKNPDGCAPHEVFFVDQSGGTFDNWSWSFPGGMPSTSNEQNPIVTYEAPGFYTVTLTVSGLLGESTIVQQQVVEVLPLPMPAFSFEQDGPVVSFTNLSTDASSYTWNFGDGNFSTEVNPVHVYTQSGTYTVTLNALNAFCANALNQQVQVVVSSVEQAFDKKVKVFPNPTSGILWISLEVPEAEVEVYNLAGQLLLRNSLRSGTNRLDLENYPEGLYLLEVSDGRSSRIFKVQKVNW